MVQLKAFTCNSFISEILEFQFLMVQLKVSGQILYILKQKVSIPNGSIKRPIITVPATVPLAFQFLMVQLKALSQFL